MAEPACTTGNTTRWTPWLILILYSREYNALINRRPVKSPLEKVRSDFFLQKSVLRGRNFIPEKNCVVIGSSCRRFYNKKTQNYVIGSLGPKPRKRKKKTVELTSLYLAFFNVTLAPTRARHGISRLRRPYIWEVNERWSCGFPTCMSGILHGWTVRGAD